MSQFPNNRDGNDHNFPHNQWHQGNNHSVPNMNRSFGPETSNINRVVSPPKSIHIVYQTNDNMDQQTRERSPNNNDIQRPSSRAYAQSQYNENEKKQKQRANMYKEVFQDLSKAFMAQITRSISEIAKATVQDILSKNNVIKQNNPRIEVNYKFSDQKKLLKSKRFQNTGGKNSIQKKQFGRVFSMQQQLKKQQSDDIDERYEGQKMFCQQLNQLQRKMNNPSLRSNNSFNINSHASGQSSQQLRGLMKGLLKEMKTTNQNKKQSRANWIQIDFEDFQTDEQAQGRIHYLKRKVFKIISDVLSVSFNMHYKQGMEYEKVKAYCCQNFIVNFCRLAKIAKIQTKQMKIIQQHLQDEVLVYLNLSYPRSQQKAMNKELKSKIGEKDIFNQNRFDIVYNSKVQMSTKHSQINSQIMKIMNYIIKLPDQKVYQRFQVSVPQQDKQQKTLYENFQRDMQTILSKVYRQDIVEKLYKSNQKQQALIKSAMSHQNYHNSVELIKKLDQSLLGYQIDYHRLKSKESEVGKQQDRQVAHQLIRKMIQQSKQNKKQKQFQKQKQQQQYKQKVQSYTKFKIGRKISHNVQPYTDQQIEQGALIIKDSSVARVLMKWVEALQDQIKDPIKNLYLRDEPFRLNNSEQTYLLSTQQKIDQLCKFYIRVAKVVEQKSQILKDNARQIFLQALKSSEMVSKFKSYRTFSTQNDAIVGHLCTILLKSRQNHVSSYLNMLLSQIKYIQQEYQWQIQDKRINIPSRPSLINMRLGDLMRCQITSKPKQIIALYTYISLLCKLDPNRFQLVRVKNRANTPNKDILINIFYHQKIMIQIQLAIKNQSAFISCSDRFSHFIYEFIRAFLGPINQMCSIWSLYSPKSQFFIQKFSQINIKAKEIFTPKTAANQQQHIYEDQLTGLKLPFWCSNCGILYYNGSTPRKRCINCKIYQCCICSIRPNLQKFVDSQYPDYRLNKQRLIGQIFYALDILTSHRHIKTMLKLQINGKVQAYSMKLQIEQQKDKNGVLIGVKPVVSNIKAQYQVPKKSMKINLKRQVFDYCHVILQKKSDQVRKQQQRYVIQIIKTILRDQYLAKRIKGFVKKSQSFVKISLVVNPKINKNIKGQIVQNVINNNKKLLPIIQKLNLNQNGISKLQFGCMMPNARVIVLNHNALQKLDLTGIKNLTVLQLSNNKIKSLRFLSHLQQCVNLRKLFIDQNQLDSIDGLPSQLRVLQSLSVRKNKIRTIHDLPYLQNLKSFNLNQNSLMRLAGIQRVSGLIQLKLKGNTALANSGVQLLKQLSNLRKLDMSQTNLRKTLLQSHMMLKDSYNIKNINSEFLPIYQPLIAIKSLVYLQQLDASGNDLSFVPRIPQLCNLKQLNLKQNSLRNVKNLQNFVKLKWLCLQQNQITDIKGIKALTHLYWLDLSKNKIKSEDLQQLSYLKNLHQIQLSYNRLTTIQGIGSLTKLYELSVRKNKISSLNGIQKLVSLQHFDARHNKITTTQLIQNLHILFELKLTGNRILNMDSLYSNQKMKILKLDKCQLTSITIIPKLKNLQQLYLNYNKLTDLQGITNFPSLKKLEITNNDIRCFDELRKREDVPRLSKLSYLSFSLTQQTRLQFISDVQSLEVLKIHRIQQPNQIQFGQLIALNSLGFNIQYIQTSQRQYQPSFFRDDDSFEDDNNNFLKV